jgi:hypothetical protein
MVFDPFPSRYINEQVRNRQWGQFVLGLLSLHCIFPCKQTFHCIITTHTFPLSLGLHHLH